MVEPPASAARLPGGRYAVASFKGRGADIGVAWSELLRQWLPSSSMQIDTRPLFELYDADAREDPATGVFEYKLCIPVRPL
jgi:AraC family transcriptional regulator